MKSSGRRQVRTPLGNKTKRGAELEGTPKTPRSYEVSPCMSNCVDSFSQEPEDGKLQLKSRRPLQWNNLPKQEINAIAAVITTEEYEAVAALSPICVNSIRGNSDQQGGRIKSAMKKPNEMRPSVVPPKIEYCNAASKILGSCPSSPECRTSPLSGGRMFFWSNAAFNQQPAHKETVCISKETASSSSCSLSGSSSRHKAITERADCEVEIKTTEQDYLPEIDGGRNYDANGRQRESPILDGTVNAMHGIGNSEFSGQEDQETQPHCSRGQFAELSENSLARKLLFENDKSSSCGSVLEPDYGVIPHLVQQRSATKEHTYLRKSVVQACQAAKNEEQRLETGLDEIEQEIQLLTERLTELQLQKLTREKEMRRHGEEKTKKAEAASYVGRKEAADRDRSVVAMLPQLPQRQVRRSALTAVKRGKGVISISSSSASVVQSPRGQRPPHEVVSKLIEETHVCRQVQCPSTARVSKLSEVRRSVSSASRRMESSNRSSSDAEADRSKVLRRLSMSGSMMSSPSNVQGQQQQQRSLANKGGCTPSRVVSSRYGRAITPDACRPSGVACKKRNRPSFSAASSPLPQPPASAASSPLQKVATLRSGYPSRSGFATPAKQLKPISTAAVPPSNTAASSSSSSLRAQNLRRFLHSPSKSPIARRIDSPKSTAALHKCLESLLEDSKHFFKRLSPARLHLQHPPLNPQQQQQLQSISSANALSPPSSCLPATE